jgi:citrate lyase subunit beta / citryl-CoA lyase
LTELTIRPRRSVLYMPGANTRAHEKGRSLPVDSIIIDLEDSIAPEMKGEAREIACATIRQGGFGQREVAIRINGLNTPWGAHDLVAAVAARPDAIVLTKVESPVDVARVGAAVRAAGVGPIPVWAMIETPLALLNIRDIAAFEDAHGPLGAFVLGTNDIAKELRVREAGDRMPMLSFLSTCVLAARAYGLDVLDGVFNDFSDEAGFRGECEHGRDIGMDGKTLIHPGQIAVANEVFAPSAEEVEKARGIIAAFDLPENRGKGAINLDGRMVEILHADIARRTVALAEAITAREEA